jgi:mycofactocin system FadH/OYE family oxidoreductase 2
LSKYPHLFSPLRIGPVTVRNRVMSTAQITHFAVDGTDSRRDLDYLVAKARGGIALIIVGNRLVHPTSTQTMPRFPWGYQEEFIPVQRRITEAVHAEGAAIIAQVNHFGLNGASEWDDLRVLWGPSAVRSPASLEIPKVMEKEDLAELTAAWGRTCENMRSAGFDGVEIHIGHSYLLHQFASPIWNKRRDEYGGSLENRLRLAREIIDDVRRRVGTDFVVGIRIALNEHMAGALTPDDAVAQARLLEATGQIDYVNATSGGYHNLWFAAAPADLPDGWLVDELARVKQAVGLPTFVVGGIKDAAFAESILAEGKADMVAMTRAHIADPDWVRKVQEGREDEIYHCIRCNQSCLARLFKGMPIGCTVNPVTGRERKWGELPRAATPARWLVVGGGPAGMKAAETLAKRGHEVVLLERERELGGQVRAIVRTPRRESFAWIVRDLETQLRVHGVDVRLGTEATPALVAELAPAGVVVATGSRPVRTGFSVFAPLVDRLPGSDLPNVLTWQDVLDGADVGKRVALLEDDGGRAPAGIAELLLERGAAVRVVTPYSALFPATVATVDQALLYQATIGRGLEFTANAWATSWDGSVLRVASLYGAPETTVEADSLVVMTQPEAVAELYFALKEQVANVHRIGDCVAPRKLDHAIYEGYLAGRELWTADERYILEGELERWTDAVAQPV